MDASFIDDYLSRLPRLAASKPPQVNPDISNVCDKPHQDVFETIPCEVMALIVDYVPTEDIKALTDASSAVIRALFPVFWKRRLIEDLPWMWDFLTEDHGQQVDWKQVYEDLQASCLHMSRSAVKNLVNRRRIWKVSCQLAILYNSKSSTVRPQENGTSTQISTKTVCPFPTSPHPNQWSAPYREKAIAISLPEANDFENRHSILRTYWNIDFNLTGLSVEIQGCAERLFGLRSTDSNIKTVVFEEGDWLKKLVLRISNGIKSINITTQRQRHIELAPGWQSDDERPDVDDHCPRPLPQLQARGEMIIVGFHGAISGEIISRIGVIESIRDLEGMDHAMELLLHETYALTGRQHELQGALENSARHSIPFER